MTLRIAATRGVAALAVIGLATVTACSSGSSSSPSSTPAASATGSASASSGASDPLSGGAASGTVVIGSANFPENEVLAETYALALKAKGVKVTTKLNIGAREVYYPQIEKGAISVIPEYNGALLTTSVDTSSTAATTAHSAVHGTMRFIVSRKTSRRVGLRYCSNPWSCAIASVCCFIAVRRWNYRYRL